MKPHKDYLDSRVPVLVNNDLHIVLAAPQGSLDITFIKMRMPMR
jgi:homogentisate 1,2-dioxygenase